MSKVHRLCTKPLGLVLAWVPASVAPAQPQRAEFPNEEPWEWKLAPVAVELKGYPTVTAEPNVKLAQVVLLELAGDWGPDVGRRTPALSGPVRVMTVDRVEGVAYRVVGFDRQGDRIPFSSRGSVGNPTSGCAIWEVELADRTVAFLGIEQLSPEGRKRKAPLAIEKLRKLGVTLTYPEEGKTFEYSYKDRDGRTARLADFRGQVILINWWASW